MKADDNKAKFLSKFDAPAKPVLTQVVPVIEDGLKKPGKAEKNKDEPKDHFNVNLPKQVGKALRMHKLNTGETVQDILEKIVTEYLISKGELPSQ